MPPAANTSSLQDWCPDCNPWLIALAVILPTFMEVLDTSIASVALPHIAGSLSATTDEATWVLTSYLVANAVILPASGWFSLRYGRRNFFIFCIAVFTIASFLCGSATSLAWILLARAVQGAGGGALQPLSQSILLESFPREKRGGAMAAFGLGVVVAPVLGPTLGGWLTDQYSWRWAFYINVPVGIVAILMIIRFVKDPPYIQKAKVGRIDSIGLGLLALWLGALQIVLDKGQEDDWFGSVWIRWTAAIMIIGFVFFLVRELRARSPLVNLRVFKDRNLALGCLLIGLFGAIIYGLVTILPLFYQTLMGYTAGAAGIAVSPRGLGAVMAMPLVAILTRKIDNRYLIATGFLLFSWAGYWMGGLTLNISQWSELTPIVLSGVASGMIFVPLSTTAMATLRNEEIGNASGLYNLFRNVGGSIGISMMNTTVARHSQIHRAELARYMSHNGVFDLAWNKIHALMSSSAGPRLADLRTYALMQRALDQQSAVYSYVDDLRYLSLMSLICVPVVFLVRSAKAKAGGAPSAH